MQCSGHKSPEFNSVISWVPYNKLIFHSSFISCLSNFECNLWMSPRCDRVKMCTIYIHKHVEFIRDGMKMFLPIPNVTCVLRVPNLHQLDDFVYSLKWRKHFLPYDTTGRKKPLTHLYISSEYSIYAIVLSIHANPGFWSICLSHSPATEKKPLEIWKSAELTQTKTKYQKKKKKSPLVPKTSGNWSQTQSYSLKMLNFFKVSPVIGTLETNHKRKSGYHELSGHQPGTASTYQQGSFSLENMTKFFGYEQNNISQLRASSSGSHSFNTLINPSSSDTYTATAASSSLFPNQLLLIREASIPHLEVYTGELGKC